MNPKGELYRSHFPYNFPRSDSQPLKSCPMAILVLNKRATFILTKKKIL